MYTNVLPSFIKLRAKTQYKTKTHYKCIAIFGYPVVYVLISWKKKLQMRVWFHGVLTFNRITMVLMIRNKKKISHKTERFVSSWQFLRSHRNALLKGHSWQNQQSVFADISWIMRDFQINLSSGLIFHEGTNVWPVCGRNAYSFPRKCSLNKL